MNIASMKVSTRLGMGFGLVLLLLIMVSLMGGTRLTSLNEKLQAISDIRVPNMMRANHWYFHLSETARHTRNMLIFDDAEKIAKELDAIGENKRMRAEYMKQLQQFTALPQAKLILQEVIESRARYMPLEDEYLELVKAGDIGRAKALMLTTFRPAQLEYMEKLQKFIAFQNENIELVSNEAEAEYSSGYAILVGLSLVTLLVGVVVAWLITRSLVQQLGGEPSDAVAAANRIAAGDLSPHQQLSRGEKDSLMHALGAMRSNLAGIVAQVRSGTDTIAAASGQIASGNLDLSARTERQASTLEETASSMEEINATVKQNADSARQANQLAISASDVAIKGGAVVSQVVDTMSSINASSRKIVEIIAVIDGIAFQTNILALNAAVEAARAGEEGRGFAVVATEVRNLAQRSASAAKEIKDLIGASVAQIDVGSKLVDQAGLTMGEIVTSVKRVTDIMGEIATASGEQETGIAQVNNAISEMDATTQENAALVEQAAAASHALQDQAQALAQAVGIFRLDQAEATLKPVSGAAGQSTSVAVIARQIPVRSKKVARAAPVAESGWVEF